MSEVLGTGRVPGPRLLGLDDVVDIVRAPDESRSAFVVGAGHERRRGRTRNRLHAGRTARTTS
ncbi:hypothetical protein [Actinoallomurus acanthiterrae]